MPKSKELTMWYTNQSVNVIISFIGRGHTHSFVSRYMVCLKMHIYDFVKSWHYSDGTSLIYEE